MDLVSAIRKRRSVRHYEDRPVPRDTVAQVIQAGDDAVALYPGIDVRWYIVWDGNVITRRLHREGGLHGMFATAPHYLLAVSEERPGYMENLGFRMEQLILTATALGLGTCWIGEMFREAHLSDFVPDLNYDERIVAITPLGYPDTSESAHIARRLLRWGDERLAERKPLSQTISHYIWTIPWAGEDESMGEILELTRLAPSWNNTQPWRFVVDDRWVIATVDVMPQRGNVHEGKTYCRLDGGIAMCHFFLAARAEGWTDRWLIPEAAEVKMVRDRYAIPETHEVLGMLRRA